MIGNRSSALVLTVLLVSVGAGVFAGFHFWMNRVGSISHANYERITIGMPLDEVARLLGSPGEVMARHYVRQYWRNGGTSVPAVTGDMVRIWKNNGIEITIGIINGKVTSKDYWEVDL